MYYVNIFYMYQIGNKIKEYRVQLGISQAFLAQKLNVNQTLISQWERNICEPSIDSIRKICVLFDVSADDLLSLDTEKERENLISNIKNLA